MRSAYPLSSLLLGLLCLQPKAEQLHISKKGDFHHLLWAKAAKEVCVSAAFNKV